MPSAGKVPLRASERFPEHTYPRNLRKRHGCIVEMFRRGFPFKRTGRLPFAAKEPGLAAVPMCVNEVIRDPARPLHCGEPWAAIVSGDQRFRPYRLQELPLTTRKRHLAISHEHGKDRIVGGVERFVLKRIRRDHGIRRESCARIPLQPSGIGFPDLRTGSRHPPVATGKAVLVHQHKKRQRRIVRVPKPRMRIHMAEEIPRECAPVRKCGVAERHKTFESARRKRLFRMIRDAELRPCDWPGIVEVHRDVESCRLQAREEPVERLHRLGIERRSIPVAKRHEPVIMVQTH